MGGNSDGRLCLGEIVYNEHLQIGEIGQGPVVGEEVVCAGDH